jgi:UDP-2,3-diacylglucosamine pyrophosphatase LpxH
MRVVLVSDLHLGAGDEVGRRHGPAFGEQFHDDEAFEAFLSHQRARGDHRLVLLGDAFDLLHVPVTAPRAALYARSDEQALGQLRAVLEAHPLVRDALAATAVRHPVDVVLGNHDVELARPALQRELRSVLGPGVAVHPFALHLPGVLHAQHGHHHHDINTFRDPQHPVGPRGTAERPPAARLHALRAGLGAPRAFARELPTVALSRRGPRRPAEAEGPLPAQVVADLVALGSTSVPRIARRVARKALARGRGPLPPYGAVAATRVRDVLARHGWGVPFVAFGHTHVAGLEPMGDDGWYLNTGTWSCDARGADGARLTWLEVTEGVATLWRWDGEPVLLGASRVTAPL